MDTVIVIFSFLGHNNKTNFAYISPSNNSLSVKPFYLQYWDPFIQGLCVLVFVWDISWIVYMIINNSTLLLLTKYKEFLWCNAYVRFSKREWWCNVPHVNGFIHCTDSDLQEQSVCLEFFSIERGAVG